MEPLTQTKFAAAVLCLTQAGEAQKIEVVRSLLNDNPYLDIPQYPHVDFRNIDNARMGNTTRENIAVRLN